MDQENPAPTPLVQEPVNAVPEIVPVNPMLEGLPQSSMQTSPVPSKSKKKIWIIAGSTFLGLVIIIGAGSYVVFAQGKTKLGVDFQDKMWANVLDSSNNIKALDTSLAITYQDTGTFKFVPSEAAKKFGLDSEVDPATLQQYDTEFSFNLDNLKAKTALSGFFNDFDDAHQQGDLTLQEDISNGGINYSVSGEGKVKSNDAYYKYDYNQAVADSALVKALSGLVDPTTYKNQWVKTTNPDSASSSSSADNQAQVDKELAILKANRPFDIQSFKGITSVNGHETAHYALSLDKAKIRTIILQNLKLNDSSLSQSDTDYYMQFVDDSLSKTNVQDFEVWIGLSDHHLYKFVYQTNAISLTQSLPIIEDKLGSIVGTASMDTQAKSSDAKRLADARLMGTALELSYNDNDGYPAADNGAPVGMVPAYLGTLPTAPTPPSGSCNDFYNNYWYVPTGTPIISKSGAKVYPSFEYTFCLGNTTSGLTAGVNKMTPSGMQDDAEDTAKLPAMPAVSAADAALVDTAQDPKQAALNLFKSLPYNAQITIENTVSSYDKNSQVETPTDFKDSSQPVSGGEVDPSIQQQ